MWAPSGPHHLGKYGLGVWQFSTGYTLYIPWLSGQIVTDKQMDTVRGDCLREALQAEGVSTAERSVHTAASEAVLL